MALIFNSFRVINVTTKNERWPAIWKYNTTLQEMHAKPWSQQSVSSAYKNSTSGGLPMNKFPSQETVERIRKRYPVGCRVELVRMNDPYTKLKPGDRGTVAMVDSIGTVFVNWDCGSGLGIVCGEDSCRILTE